MFELVQIGKNTFYIESPAKIGIYTVEDGVFLIDSGNDKDAGRKIRKILDEKGWKLKGIISTHSNADHIGGNRYLQNNTGCRVFAGGIEKSFTENPILEPSFLYGGYPFKELRHKFLMAQPSECTDFEDVSFPEELQIIELKGHFFDMVGVMTPDNIFFVADSLVGEDILEKYALSYIYDVAGYLETLDFLETINAEVFVPSHGAVTDNIYELTEKNRRRIYQIIDDILNIVAESGKISTEMIVSRLFTMYDMTITWEQSVLIGNCTKSYLSYLKDNGRIDGCFEDNMLLWHIKGGDGK